MYRRVSVQAHLEPLSTIPQASLTPVHSPLDPLLFPNFVLHEIHPISLAVLSQGSTQLGVVGSIATSIHYLDALVRSNHVCYRMVPQETVEEVSYRGL